MTKPFDIAGLCVESAPARSRNRTAMLVAPIGPGHSAEAIGVLFELWDSPPAWFAVPSLDLQPSLAHALVTGAGENLGKQLNSRAASEALGALESERKVLYAGSGAMAVAVVAHAERFAIGWVGTTRAYLVRGGVVEQLTQEHTLQNDALKCGVSAEEAAKLPADVLTRVLRMREDGERTPVDVVTRDLQPGDRGIVSCW